MEIFCPIHKQNWNWNSAIFAVDRRRRSGQRNLKLTSPRQTAWDLRKQNVASSKNEKILIFEIKAFFTNVDLEYWFR